MKIKINDRIVDCVVTDLVINGINEGKVVCDWEVLIMLMDDDLRNQLHDEFVCESNEEFLEEYLKLDPNFMNVIQQNALSIGEGDTLYTVETGFVDSAGGLDPGAKTIFEEIYYVNLEDAEKDFQSFDIGGQYYKSIEIWKLGKNELELEYEGQEKIEYGKKAEEIMKNTA
jgi:hypothetical protein